MRLDRDLCANLINCLHLGPQIVAVTFLLCDATWDQQGGGDGGEEESSPGPLATAGVTSLLVPGGI